MALDKQSLLEFAENKLGVDVAGVEEDTPLFSSGRVDSAGMVDLIVFVESEGSVTFGPDDITLENLDSIGSILRYVAQARGR